jgi:hypothetical protein
MKHLGIFATTPEGGRAMFPGILTGRLRRTWLARPPGCDHAYVDDVVLEDDDAIRGAQRTLWQTARIATKPAACVGTAALLTGAYKPAPGERVAVVITGANVSPSQLDG